MDTFMYAVLKDVSGCRMDCEYYMCCAFKTQAKTFETSQGYILDCRDLHLLFDIFSRMKVEKRLREIGKED